MGVTWQAEAAASIGLEREERERGRARARRLPPLPRLLRLDDIRLGRRQQRDELLLLLPWHLELVQGLAEVLDHRVPILFRDAHALVHRLHVLAGIGARAA